MPTAVITKSSQTQILAGMTNYIVSGQDSYDATSSPNDSWTNIAEWSWELSDGQAFAGANIMVRVLLAGTYTLILTVKNKNGVTNSASTTITFADRPSFSGFHKYVRSDGSDGNSGNANTSGGAYNTMQKAYDVWRSSLPRSDWGVIELNAGDTLDYDHSIDPDYGPLLVRRIGIGANPIINCTSTNGDGFRVSSSGHDESYAHPTYYDGVDILFPNSVNAGLDQWNLVSLGHVANQFSNGTITKAGILMNNSTGGSTGPDGGSLWNVTQTGSWRNGLFLSCAFGHVKSCTFTNNGSEDARDNGIYVSNGADRFGVVACVIQRGIPPGGADFGTFGMNHSGSSYGWIDGLVTLDVITAFGPGGNASPPGEETTDLICNNLGAIGTHGVGLYPDYCQRVSIRNPVFVGGCANGAIVIQEASATQYVQGFQVLNGSFHDIEGAFIFFNSDTHSTGILVENCAVTKPAGGTVDSKWFINCPQAQNVAALTTNANVYKKTGGAAGDSDFANRAGSNDSFTSWKSNTGKDGVSKYADPLFSNPAGYDLRLMPTSPCIDAGLSLGVISKDADGVARPIGPAYDVGAYESDGFVDVTPPSVSMIGSSGAPLSGTVTLRASAVDDVGVVGVQFRVDGINVGIEDLADPYQTSWDTTSVVDGEHVVTAVARDAAGNSAESSGLTVTVDNSESDELPPDVAVTFPLDGHQVSGTILISVAATDNVAVALVTVSVDGLLLGTAVTASPGIYSIHWDTRLVANGPHTISSTAIDPAGNSATSDTITAQVANLPDSGGGGGGNPPVGPIVVGSYGTGPFIVKRRRRLPRL